MKTLLKLLVVTVVLSSCSTYRSAYHYEPMYYYSRLPMSTKQQYSIAQEYFNQLTNSKKPTVTIVEKVGEKQP
jgi:hypothetical protein